MQIVYFCDAQSLLWNCASATPSLRITVYAQVCLHSVKPTTSLYCFGFLVFFS